MRVGCRQESTVWQRAVKLQREGDLGRINPGENRRQLDEKEKSRVKVRKILPPAPSGWKREKLSVGPLKRWSTGKHREPTRYRVRL